MQNAKRVSKKVSLVAIFLAILMSSTIAAHAAARWNYFTSISGDMDISDNGDVLVTVACFSDLDDTNKITAKCELQQYKGSWKTIKTWTETNKDARIRYTKTYALASNYSYRLKITASTYKDSTLLEQITGIYAETFFR